MSRGNEAQARVKINKLLEAAGWRFEAEPEGPANIFVESGVKYSELGDDFEDAVSRTGSRGAIDFLLLDKDKKANVKCQHFSPYFLVFLTDSVFYTEYERNGINVGRQN